MVTNIYLLDCSVAVLTSIFYTLPITIVFTPLNGTELIYSSIRPSLTAPGGSALLLLSQDPAWAVDHTERGVTKSCPLSTGFCFLLAVI